MMSTVNLNVRNWENWEFSFPPAPILNAVSGWEGGQYTPEPSETGAAPADANQLRDPYVFEDSDDSLYLIYAGNGESGLGIAAMSSRRQQIDVLGPRGDAYTRGGDYANTNFGNADTIEVKQGNNEIFFPQSLLEF